MCYQLQVKTNLNNHGGVEGIKSYCIQAHGKIKLSLILIEAILLTYNNSC